MFIITMKACAHRTTKMYISKILKQITHNTTQTSL